MKITTFEAEQLTNATSAVHISAAKLAKNRELIAAYDKEMTVLEGAASEKQQKTYFIQAAEARAWLSDNNAATPHLAALATERGVAISDAVARVISKADALAVASGALNGRLQARQDLLFGRGAAVKAAATIEEILAIVW